MAKDPMDNIEPGIKVTAQMSPEPTEEDNSPSRWGLNMWCSGQMANTLITTIS